VDSETRTCEHCRNLVEYNRGYLTWCECGWRISPVRSTVKATRLQRFTARRHAQRGAAAIDHVVAGGSRRPPPLLRLLFVGAVALPLYAVFALLLITAARLVRLVPTDPLLLIPISLLLATAWPFRFRIGRLPKGTLGADQAPVLHSVMEKIRAELGGPRVDRFVFSTELTVSITSYGFRGTRVVEIGAPFAAVVSPLELVATLAHEQGHALNGDPARGRFVGSTATTLVSLADRCYSLAYLCDSEGGLAGVLGFVFHALAAVFVGLLVLIIRVTWWDRQICELRADVGGAKIAGSKVMVGLFEKFELFDGAAEFLRGMCLRPEPKLADELRKTYRTVPNRALELSRRRIVVAAPAAEFDATHPPLRDRIAVVERSAAGGTVPTLPISWLDAGLLAELDKEVHGLAEPLIVKTVDAVRMAEMENYQLQTPPWLRPTIGSG
jgi:Zn-dependent protease with chaperone function